MKVQQSVSTLTAELRDAIESSHLTRYEIGRQANVSESILSRFMRGKQGLTLETADRVASVLGLRLRKNE